MPVFTIRFDLDQNWIIQKLFQIQFEFENLVIKLLTLISK